MESYISNNKATIVVRSILGSCIRPLLDAMNWRGTERQLKEAMPHFVRIQNVNMFCKVFENLNFKAREISSHMHKVDERLLPCMFVAQNGTPMVLLEKNDRGYRVFDGERNAETSVTYAKAKALRGTIFAFKAIEREEHAERSKTNWVRRVFRHNKGLVYSALILSLLLNILALATPIYIMSVYDRVISTASTSMLSAFVIGIAIVVIVSIVIQRIRSQLFAILGAKLDREIGDTIFERLLYLSPLYTEMATVGGQVARIRDFDRLREFVTGPMLSVLFDLPFIVLSLVIIAYLAGSLVFVPIVMIGVFVLLSMTLTRKVQYKIRKAGERNIKINEFLLEAIRKIRAIKFAGKEGTWIHRHRNLAAESAHENFKITFLGALNSALSDIIMIATGLAVVCFGALLIMQGAVSVGALVAVMILTWRVLSPIKILFNTYPRIQQIRNSFAQINRLLKIEPETNWRDMFFIDHKQLRGELAFQRVSFRYQSAYDPALLGVNFKIPAGSLVGVMGRNGSGKSTVLKLLMGLYQPQAGSILVDGRDIRQMNVLELRSHISYLPQSFELFYGTIGQNLLLAKPDATEEDLHRAAQQAGMLGEVLAMPRGFDTPVRDNAATRLSASFQQKLCLARVYLKQNKIVLLDEPASALDDEADQQLMNMLDTLRGKVTVIMVSHRPSHLRKLDHILFFDNGQLIAQGAPDDVLPKVPEEML